MVSLFYSGKFINTREERVIVEQLDARSPTRTGIYSIVNETDFIKLSSIDTEVNKRERREDENVEKVFKTHVAKPQVEGGNWYGNTANS